MVILERRMLAERRLSELMKLVVEMQKSGLLYASPSREPRKGQPENVASKGGWASLAKLATNCSRDVLKAREVMLAVENCSPDLVVFKARVELEKKLRELAETYGIRASGDTKVSEVVPLLLNRGVLTASQSVLIQKFYRVLSGPVHGEDVCSAFARVVVDRIIELLMYLESKRLAGVARAA